MLAWVIHSWRCCEIILLTHFMWPGYYDVFCNVQFHTRSAYNCATIHFLTFLYHIYVIAAELSNPQRQSHLILWVWNVLFRQYLAYNILLSWTIFVSIITHGSTFDHCKWHSHCSHWQKWPILGSHKHMEMGINHNRKWPSQTMETPPMHTCLTCDLQWWHLGYGPLVWGGFIGKQRCNYSLISMHHNFYFPLYS